MTRGMAGHWYKRLPRHDRGINPSRLAMILSTIRFGRIAVTSCRTGSGAIW